MVAHLEKMLPWLVVALAVIWGLRRLDNTDTWWHLAAGRWIAEHGTVPRTDTLSFTVPDHGWINLQWLYELGLYGLYRLGGASLVVVVTSLVYGLTTLLLVTNLRLTLGPVAATAIALWTTIVAQERFAIRPEGVSFLLLQAVIWLCASGLRTGDRRLWFLPVVMLLWANTHALFILGMFVVACATLSSAASEWKLLPPKWRQPLAPEAARRMRRAGAAALLVPLLNPYGFEGVIFPLRLMSRISGTNPAFRGIGEFRPPFSAYFVTLGVTAYQLFFFFSLSAVALALVLSAFTGAGAPVAARAQRRAEERRTGVRRRSTPVEPGQPASDVRRAQIDVAGLIVFAGFAYVSLMARRNMAVFALAAAPFVGQCLAAIHRCVPEAVRRPAKAARFPAVAVLAAMLPTIGWFVANNGFYRWSGELHEFGTGVLEVMFPIRASTFAREMRLPPPLFNDMTSGGYLTWDRSIPGGVYIDGRLEVYEAEFFSAYVRSLADPNRWQAEADRIGVQTVVFFHWWPNHQPLARKLLSDKQWALVYFDEVALIFVRRHGNDEVIAKCAAAFGPLHEAIEMNLLAPVPSGYWPVGRIRGLSTYANVLALMGKRDRAAVFRARMRELGG